MYHIIVNPVAGAQKGPDFVENIVLKLFDELQLPYRLHSTEKEKSAFYIAKDIFRNESQTVEPVPIVVVGGDGTTQEVIDGAAFSATGWRRQYEGIWELIILPFGTANAMYESLAPEIDPTISPELDALLPPSPETRKLLRSLIASLDKTREPIKLPLMITNMRTEGGNAKLDSLLPALVVWSTSLHASILQGAEELRTKFPGVERFKKAAHPILGMFYEATARLLPPAHAPITQYDPKSQSFVEPYTLGENNSLDGPFSYFLATTTCDRLEPTFVINPTVKCIPADPFPPTMDLVVIRPLRDAVVASQTARGKQEKFWRSRIMEILGHAYKGGEHIDLTYRLDGGGTEVNGKGSVVVEVFRVGGFEWTPAEMMGYGAKTCCVDGAIHVVPPSGSAYVKVVKEVAGISFRACV